MDGDDRPNDKGPPHGPGPATPLEIPGLGSIPPIGALPNPLGRLPADAIAQGLGITGIAAQSPGIGLPFPPVSPQAAPQGIFGHPIGNPGATGPGIQIGSIAGQLGSLLPFSAAPTPGGMPGAAPAAGDKDDPPPS